MLTSEDIKNLTEFQKTVFATKDDIAGLHTDFSNLQSSVESFAIGTKKNADETLIANNRISQVESWAKQAGSKIKLEYRP